MFRVWIKDAWSQILQNYFQQQLPWNRVSNGCYRNSKLERKGNQLLVAKKSLVYLWSDFYYSSDTKKISSFLSCAEPYEVNLTLETSQQLTWKSRKQNTWSKSIQSNQRQVSPFMSLSSFVYLNLDCMTQEMYQIIRSLLWSSKILYATFSRKQKQTPSLYN